MNRVAEPDSTATHPRLPALADADNPVWHRIPQDPHSGDFLRLQRLLARRGHFQLIIAQFNAPAYRDAIIAALGRGSTDATAVSVWVLPEEPDLAALRTEVTQRAAAVDGLHLIGLDAWLDRADESVLRGLNHGREALAATAPLSLVIWLRADQVRAFAEGAPDLWAWRAGLLDFALARREPLAIERGSLMGPFRVDAERARRRLAEIDLYLVGAGNDAASANLLLEASRLREGLGEWASAQALAERARDHYRALDHARGTALALGQIADILQARGQLDEALRIRTEEQLPVYERLGDVRSLLVCRTQIALNLLAIDATEQRRTANALLCLALVDAQRLRLPEAGKIEQILRRFELVCTGPLAPTPAEDGTPKST